MPQTVSGSEFEAWVEHHLDVNGYDYETQVPASGINEDWSRIDIVIYDEEMDESEAISLKYQGVGGTAEEKICYEAESLNLMCQAHGYSQATIVLAGPGWSKAKLYWFLNEYQPPHYVRIISYDDFVRQYIHVRCYGINYAVA